MKNLRPKRETNREIRRACKIGRAVVLIIFLVLYPAFAHSDVIRCHFTEPFLTTSYNTSTQIFEVRDENEALTATVKNVSFEIHARSKFELLGPDKSTIQTLILNGKGSDGMSDGIYPYEVSWTWNGSRIVGGCSSNALSRRDPDEGGTVDSP